MGQVGVCGITNPTLSPTDLLSTESMERSFNQGDDIKATLSSLTADDSKVCQDLLLKRLSDVINQNLSLKETLFQNNMAMRQQLGLMVQWCQTQKTNHQQKLIQALRSVAILQRENEALKNATKGTKATDGQFANKNDDQLQKTLQQLHQLQDEKTRLENVKTKLESDIAILKCDLGNCQGGQEQLKRQCHHLMTANAELKNNLLTMQKNECGPQQEGDYNRLRRECEELRTQLSHVTEQLRDAQSAVQSVQIDKSLFTGDVDSVRSLEKALNAERQKLSEEKNLNSRLSSEAAGLRMELQDAKDRIHRNTNTDQYYQTKIKAINEEHDAVTAKLLSYEELLSAKNEEIGKLKKESGVAKAKLAESQNEGDTVAVLRAQVEVYQNDFKAEREAREALASEREQLRDELKQLHVRNTHLLDEMQAIQQGGVRPRHSISPDVTPAKGDEKRSADVSVREKVPPVIDESLFYCPKCNTSFSELRPLEEHVNRCLDDD